MKVLLTGANGQLGRCFQDIFPKEWQLIATDSDVLDITNRQAVESFIVTHKPDIIVNAAAYTAVDKAETESELAEKINAQGTYYLALASHSIGARFFHVSTDYVFDGTKTTPYLVTDQTNPLGVYGKTKLKGEILSLQANPNTTIIRTAWVFSEYGNNFVKTVLRLAKERNELRVVNDQIGCPTYAGDLAACIIQLIKQNNESGIYHYCGNESMSWCDFANKIIDVAFEQGKIINKPKIVGIPSSEYPTPAKRPFYSVLDMKKLEKTYSEKQNIDHILSQIISKIG
ncbi:dTDP-4-dehydrorhamnose reductase [Orbus mooreae]|uniref:dTDP-4-dehydrorhamnose reductase n=1 Tax=Orbus mooreae TaxID=3074107 RepID=UPI00370D36E0